MNAFQSFKQRLGLIWAALTKPVPQDAQNQGLDETLASAKEHRLHSRVNAKPGTRVLIIDDSSTVVAVLSRLLKQNGYVTIEAENAEKGVELARTEKPDLIFLDIVLPGMNGFAALRLLRRDPGLKAVPIIMMSGNVQATEEFYMQSIGADDFLKKPFSRPEVCARIERLLDDNLMPRRANVIQAKAAAPAP